MRELYCSRDMMLCLQRSQMRSDLTTVMSTRVQDFHPARYLLSYLLLITNGHLLICDWLI